jgi:hypothetical protein
MIRRILIGLVVLGIAAVPIWLPREEFVAADAPPEFELPPAVSFRAERVPATPPFVEGWHLSYPETPPAVQVLTVQIGALEGATAHGRLTGGAGVPTPVLERIAEVFPHTPAKPAPELPHAAALDLRLDVLGERLSVGHGDVGATVIAGAFVADPAGDWRVYRMTLGEGGPQCFLGTSADARSVVLFPRTIEDGPAILASFRALLVKPGAGTD